MYKVTILPTALKSFKKLDTSIQQRISTKIDWMSEYADVIIHHQLSSLPDDLKGLCKAKVGDYRIMYWIYHSQKHIKIYEIEHRGKQYKSIRK